MTPGVHHAGIHRDRTTREQRERPGRGERPSFLDDDVAAGQIRRRQRALQHRIRRGQIDASAGIDRPIGVQRTRDGGIAPRIGQQAGATIDHTGEIQRVAGDGDTGGRGQVGIRHERHNTGGIDRDGANGLPRTEAGIGGKRHIRAAHRDRAARINVARDHHRRITSDIDGCGADLDDTILAIDRADLAIDSERAGRRQRDRAGGPDIERCAAHPRQQPALLDRSVAIEDELAGRIDDQAIRVDGIAGHVNVLASSVRLQGQRPDGQAIAIGISTTTQGDRSAGVDHSTHIQQAGRINSEAALCLDRAAKGDVPATLDRNRARQRTGILNDGDLAGVADGDVATAGRQVDRDRPRRADGGARRHIGAGVGHANGQLAAIDRQRRVSAGGYDVPASEGRAGIHLTAERHRTGIKRDARSIAGGEDNAAGGNRELACSAEVSARGRKDDARKAGCADPDIVGIGFNGLRRHHAAGNGEHAARRHIHRARTGRNGAVDAKVARGGLDRERRRIRGTDCRRRDNAVERDVDARDRHRRIGHDAACRRIECDSARRGRDRDGRQTRAILANAAVERDVAIGFDGDRAARRRVEFRGGGDGQTSAAALHIDRDVVVGRDFAVQRELPGPRDGNIVASASRAQTPADGALGAGIDCQTTGTDVEGPGCSKQQALIARLDLDLRLSTDHAGDVHEAALGSGRAQQRRIDLDA